MFIILPVITHVNDTSLNDLLEIWTDCMLDQAIARVALANFIVSILVAEL
jgi:hypothetical protein